MRSANPRTSPSEENQCLCDRHFRNRGRDTEQFAELLHHAVGAGCLADLAGNDADDRVPAVGDDPQEPPELFPRHPFLPSRTALTPGMSSLDDPEADDPDHDHRDEAQPNGPSALAEREHPGYRYPGHPDPATQTA
jgi:hypothetical protein